MLTTIARAAFLFVLTGSLVVGSAIGTLYYVAHPVIAEQQVRIQEVAAGLNEVNAGLNEVNAQLNPPVPLNAVEVELTQLCAQATQMGVQNCSYARVVSYVTSTGEYVVVYAVRGDLYEGFTVGFTRVFYLDSTGEILGQS